MSRWVWLERCVAIKTTLSAPYRSQPISKGQEQPYTLTASEEVAFSNSSQLDHLFVGLLPVIQEEFLSGRSSLCWLVASHPGRIPLSSIISLLACCQSSRKNSSQLDYLFGGLLAPLNTYKVSYITLAVQIRFYCAYMWGSVCYSTLLIVVLVCSKLGPFMRHFLCMQHIQ